MKTKNLNKICFYVFLFFCFFVLVYGCGEAGSKDDNSSSPSPTPAVSLTMTPEIINSGGSSILTWTAANAASCSANWTTSTVTSGSQTIWPAVTTSYSITCTGDGGSISGNAKVTVNFVQPPSAPTVSLSANPVTINSGGSSILTWTATNAASCSGNWTTSTAISGSQTVWPAQTTNYSITCSGDGGSVSANATVTVNFIQSPSAPIVSLSANPTAIDATGSSVLTWTAANAASCSGNWTTSTAISGSQTVWPAQTTSYSITCSGDGGSASANATVTVTIADACVENPGIMIAGNNSLANNIGQVMVSGENTVYLTYTESNLTDTHAKLMFSKSIDGGQTFTNSVFSEFDHTVRLGNNGNRLSSINISGVGSINMIWMDQRSGLSSPGFRVVFNRSTDEGLTWTSDVQVPVFADGLGYLLSNGSNLYTIYMTSADSNTIWMNSSPDNGQTWQPASVIYSSPNASINSFIVQIDAAGKLYVSMFEMSLDGSERYASMITSADQGSTWNVQRNLLPANEGMTNTEVDENGIIYQIYQISSGEKTLRSSADFASWTTISFLPPEVTNVMRSYRLHLFNGGYAIVGFSDYCVDASGNLLRSILFTKSSDGINWSIPTKHQTVGIGDTSKDFIWPTFFSEITPAGKINTLWETMTSDGLLLSNDPSDVWYMREP